MNRYTEINKILMKWNPLSVIGPALSDEYIGLIPLILVQESESNLEFFLRKTLSTHYGIEYEDNEEEFQFVIKRLVKILEINKK